MKFFFINFRIRIRIRFIYLRKKQSVYLTTNAAIHQKYSLEQDEDSYQISMVNNGIYWDGINSFLIVSVPHMKLKSEFSTTNPRWTFRKLEKEVGLLLTG